MLKIKNYSKSYTKDKKVVDNLSLEVKKGDIFIDGMSIKNNPIECKKKMAYIPDNPDLYEHLTGIKYLNFIADSSREFSITTRRNNFFSSDLGID